MVIKLKTKWMGNPKGEVIDLQESVAQRLINWGSAELYVETEEKSVKASPRNKQQLRGAATTKAVTA